KRLLLHGHVNERLQASVQCSKLQNADGGDQKGGQDQDANDQADLGAQSQMLHGSISGKEVAGINPVGRGRPSIRPWPVPTRSAPPAWRLRGSFHGSCRGVSPAAARTPPPIPS